MLWTIVTGEASFTGISRSIYSHSPLASCMFAYNSFHPWWCKLIRILPRSSFIYGCHITELFYFWECQQPENLLLDNQGNLKVSDFGLSVLRKVVRTCKGYELISFQFSMIQIDQLQNFASDFLPARAVAIHILRLSVLRRSWGIWKIIALQQK